MITQGDGGSGNIPGTAGSICTISPKDTETVMNNLISRIEKLEFNLSQILGANLHTEQLSNLSSQVGWVYGVEYMGTPGWIQTSYGSLIPPAGFTLSESGFMMANACTGEETPYQGAIVDSDGILQFGWTPVGEMCGEQVENWNLGAINDYYIYAAGDTVAANPTQISGVGITLIDNDLSTVTQYKPLNSLTFQVARDGVYSVTVSARGQISSTTGAAFPYIGARIHATADGGSEQADSTFQGREEILDDSRAAVSLTCLVRMLADQYVETSANVGLYGGGSALFQHLTRARISIHWVAPL